MKLGFEKIPPSHDCLFKVSYHDEQNPCNVFWHYHPELEIVYVPSGTSKRIVGEHSGVYTEGDLVLIAPDVPHLNFNYHKSKDHKEIVIQFNLQTVLSALAPFPDFSSLRSWLRSINCGVFFGEKTKQMVADEFRSLLHLPMPDQTLVVLGLLTKLSAAKDAHNLAVSSGPPLYDKAGMRTDKQGL